MLINTEAVRLAMAIFLRSLMNEAAVLLPDGRMVDGADPEALVVFLKQADDILKSAHAIDVTIVSREDVERTCINAEKGYGCNLPEDFDGDIAAIAAVRRAHGIEVM